MPFQFLITFGLLFAAEKSRDYLRWNPFVAALVYVVPAMLLKPVIILLGSLMMHGTVTWSSPGETLSLGNIGHWIVQYVVAVVILCILARYEDTTATWMIMFIGGFIVLEYVL